MIGKLSLEKELEIMATFKLDANLWYLTRTLFIAKFESDTTFLSKYLLECAKSGAPREMLVELQNRKILSSKYKIPKKGEALDLNKLDFNDTFIKKYFKTSLEAGQELFDAYPVFLKMDNGKLLPAKNITTKVVFTSLEVFYLNYCKSIRFDRSLHDKVMASLEYAKDKDLIQYGIAEYVVSKKWEDHIKLMEEACDKPLSKRYDSTELV